MRAIVCLRPSGWKCSRRRRRSDAVQRFYRRSKEELDANGVLTYKGTEIEQMLGQDVQAVDAE